MKEIENISDEYRIYIYSIKFEDRDLYSLYWLEDEVDKLLLDESNKVKFFKTPIKLFEYFDFHKNTSYKYFDRIEKWLKQLLLYYNNGKNLNYDSFVYSTYNLKLLYNYTITENLNTEVFIKKYEEQFSYEFVNFTNLIDDLNINLQLRDSKDYILTDFLDNNITKFIWEYYYDKYLWKEIINDVKELQYEKYIKDNLTKNELLNMLNHFYRDCICIENN